MTPWEHELSQMLGKAAHIIPTSLEIATRVELVAIISEIEEEFDAFDLDLRLESGWVQRLLKQWQTENGWLFYELTEAGWTA